MTDPSTASSRSGPRPPSVSELSISVVIPCRDAEPYLAQTIGSALDQTLVPYEVIVVDDGSTDASVAIARRFERPVGSRVRVLSGRCGSASATRNLGASVASGDALMFLDADDVIAPDTLDALATALVEEQAGVALCPWYRVELKEGRWVSGPASCAPRRRGDDLLASWLRGWYRPTCSVLWDREAFQRAGRWDESCRQNDDGDLMIRALAYGTAVAQTDRGAGFYRRLPRGQTSLSGTRLSRPGLEARLRVARKIAYLLHDQGRRAPYRAALADHCRAIAADARPEHHDLATEGEALARSIGGLASRLSRARDRAEAVRSKLGRRLGPPVDSVRRRPRHRADGRRDGRPTSGEAGPTGQAVRHGLDLAAATEHADTTTTDPGGQATVGIGAIGEASGGTHAKPVPPPPTVSVIVPTYNRAPLLPRALNSITSQSFGDFEVLVIDDGSADDTPALMAALDDERIRYLRQSRNAGVSAARNRGLREARGRLIAFLDSDDEWLPELLARHVAHFDELGENVGLVYSGGEHHTDGGHVEIRRPTASGEQHEAFLRDNLILGISGTVIRRSVIATIGFFDEDIPAIEDYDYWVRLTDFFRIGALDEPLYRYHDERAAGERKSRHHRQNQDARAYLYRKHGREMRRTGVAGAFWVKSARRELMAGNAGRGRVMASRAAVLAPTSPDVHHLLTHAWLPRSVRSSVVARAVGDARQRRRHPSGAMRVLLFTSTTRRKRGGVQVIYDQLVTGLRSHGHSVYPAWGEPDPAGAPTWGVFRLQLPRFGGSLRSMPAYLKALARFLRGHLRLAIALAGARPTIVNVHFARSELVGFTALRWLFGYRLVVSVHGTDLIRPTPRDERVLARLLPRADAITAVSPELATLATSVPGVDGAKVHMITNGIDLAFWSQPLAVDRSAATILNVGRLNPGHKGQDVLLHAHRHVLRSVPSARLVLIGGGPAAPLQELADQLEIAHAVHIVGQLEPEAVREEMAKATVFALPSTREGLPLVLLEAMAAGLPPVATPVGSVPDVVTDGSGVLVPVGDPDALAKALVALLTDPERRAQVASRAAARAQNFDTIETEARYEQLFSDLLGGR